MTTKHLQSYNWTSFRVLIFGWVRFEWRWKELWSLVSTQTLDNINQYDGCCVDCNILCLNQHFILPIHPQPSTRCGLSLEILLTIYWTKLWQKALKMCSLHQLQQINSFVTNRGAQFDLLLNHEPFNYFLLSFSKLIF